MFFVAFYFFFLLVFLFVLFFLNQKERKSLLVLKITGSRIVINENGVLSVDDLHLLSLGDVHSPLRHREP